MRYVVYNKKTGEIVRTYRKMLGESGELVPANDNEILSGLPHGVSREDVTHVGKKELHFEKGKSYKVDVKTQEIVEVAEREPRKR